MAMRHVPARTVACCDRCGTENDVEADPDAAWRPGWKPDVYHVTINGTNKDLCSRCHGELETFLATSPK